MDKIAISENPQFPFQIKYHLKILTQLEKRPYIKCMGRIFYSRNQSIRCEILKGVKCDIWIDPTEFLISQYESKLSSSKTFIELDV